MGISGAARSSIVTTQSRVVLFEWNETDLTQFEEVYRDTGADGVLSVDTNVAEPYQKIVKFTTAGGSSLNDYVFYRLLDANGDPIIIPKRSQMTCRLGPSNNFPGATFGTNLTPMMVPWYVDENHRIHIQGTGSGSTNILFVIANGGANPHVWSYKNATSVKTNYGDTGDLVYTDLDMRKPSTGVDPGGVGKTGGDAGNDVQSFLLSAAGYTNQGGSTPPSTSWSVGWDGPVYAGIGVRVTVVGAAATHFSQIRVYADSGF